MNKGVDNYRTPLGSIVQRGTGPLSHQAWNRRGNQLCRSACDRMAAKARRGGADRGKESGEDGVVVDRKMIETIKEATGATEEDIRVMLFECNYDANETTSRLIDSKYLSFLTLAENEHVLCSRERQKSPEVPFKDGV